jgi:hypothetical protein
VRFDPIHDGSTRIGQSTPAEVVESLKDTYINPKAERVATIMLAGRRVFVNAIHLLPDGDQSYATAVRYGNTQISVELLAPNRAELDRYRTMFLTFLQHLEATSNE